MLFRRRRAKPASLAAGQGPDPDPDGVAGPGAGTGPGVEATHDGSRDSDAAPGGVPQTGPWDAAACPDALEGYTDLGYLRLPPTEGMQVAGTCDENGVLLEIDMAIEDVSMNLMLLASARSQNLWQRGYRQDFVCQLQHSGYECTDVQYPAGTAIRALPQGGGQDGADAVALQVEGYPGPGWMLRVVYRGSAVADPERLEMLRQLARRTVVTRADGLYGPGEVLPLSHRQLWNGAPNGNGF